MVPVRSRVVGALRYFLERLRVLMRAFNPRLPLSMVKWTWIVARLLGISVRMKEYH
jgi:hypothetical protein